jgi:hypothetical protein
LASKASDTTHGVRSRDVRALQRNEKAATWVDLKCPYHEGPFQWLAKLPTAFTEAPPDIVLEGPALLDLEEARQLPFHLVEDPLRDGLVVYGLLHRQAIQRTPGEERNGDADRNGDEQQKCAETLHPRNR